MQQKENALLERWHGKLIAYEAVIHELRALGQEEATAWRRLRDIVRATESSQVVALLEQEVLRAETRADRREELVRRCKELHVPRAMAG